MVSLAKCLIFCYIYIFSNSFYLNLTGVLEVSNRSQERKGAMSDHVAELIIFPSFGFKFGVIITPNFMTLPAFSKEGLDLLFVRVKKSLSEYDKAFISDKIRAADLRSNLTDHDRRIIAATEKFDSAYLYALFVKFNHPAERMLFEAAMVGKDNDVYLIELDPVYLDLLNAFEQILEEIGSSAFAE